MPLASLKLKPGVNVEETYTLNEAGMSTSQLIRYKNGLPQTIGGWQYFYGTALAHIPRIIFTFTDLVSVPNTAIGTDENAYLITSGTISDITPLQQNVTLIGIAYQNGSSTVNASTTALSPLAVGDSFELLTPACCGTNGFIPAGTYTVTAVPDPNEWSFVGPFTATSTGTATLVTYTTTKNSNVIKVHVPSHGLTTGATWTELCATIVGGITVYGAYIITVTDANHFTIVGSSVATTTQTTQENNGAFAGVYFFQSGSPPSAFVAPLWTFDRFGETLLACPGNGSIFFYTPNTAQANLQIVTNAPTDNAGIFMTMPAQILVAWGSSVGGIQEPNYLQWSDQLNYNSWTPTVTNQAGSATIPTGSRIVAGFQAPNQALIFTDVDVYAMTYLGGSGNIELVFGFNQIGKGCGLLAPRGVGVLNGTVFWISPGQFMSLVEGAVAPVSCTVWDQIFQDLDTNNLQKIVCAPNSQFDEIAWFYPSLSGGTGENDSYVKFNMVENAWDYGKLIRTAWQDYSAVNYPLAGDSSGFIYEHENGYTAAGGALNWSWGTGGFAVMDGDNMAFVDWIIPDFRYGFINAPSSDQSVNLTVSMFRYPQDAAVQSQTLACSAMGPGELSTRMRGRVMTVQASGTGFARLGNLKFRYQPDGKY